MLIGIMDEGALLFVAATARLQNLYQHDKQAKSKPPVQLVVLIFAEAFKKRNSLNRLFLFVFHQRTFHFKDCFDVVFFQYAVQWVFDWSAPRKLYQLKS